MIIPRMSKWSCISKPNIICVILRFDNMKKKVEYINSNSPDIKRELPVDKFLNIFKPYIELGSVFKTINLGQTSLTIDGKDILLDNELILQMADEIRNKLGDTQ